MRTQPGAWQMGQLWRVARNLLHEYLYVIELSTDTYV